MHATAFALGIHEDTGSLTYSSTTHRDVEALAACVRLGANQEQLARYLRSPLQRDQRELLGRLIAARTERDVAGLRIVAAAASAGRYVEDASSLVSRVGDSTDWDALFLCVEMEGRVLVVARSRTPALSVDEAVASFGGGGHAQAASAVAREGDPAAVLERVLVEAARVTEEPPRAGQVMSRPVHAVASDELISATLVECQRLGLSGIQVSEDGHLTGVVAREDLDRAVRHGLSHAPVKGVMSSGIDVIGADATLGELRDLLATGRAEPARGRGRGTAPVRGPGPDRERAGRGHPRRPAARPARAGGPGAADAGPRGDRRRAGAAPHHRAAPRRAARDSAAAAPKRGCTWSAEPCATCCWESRASTWT